VWTWLVRWQGHTKPNWPHLYFLTRAVAVRTLHRKH
jgi:hypothetical protein